MSEWNDRVLILRVGHFHESDLWLKVISVTRGLATLFAFGGARSKRRFCGCLDVFNTLACRIKSSRNGAYLNLEEAELLSGPNKLRADWRGMGVAANCLRFMEALSIGDENAGECFGLLEGLRELLEASRATHAWIPVYFRLKVAAAIGFAPDFHVCPMCGDRPPFGFFSPEEGRLYCESCSRQQGKGMTRTLLNQEILKFLRSLLRDSPQNWPPLDLDPQDARVCARVADDFARFHLGLVWDNGFFRAV